MPEAMKAERDMALDALLAAARELGEEVPEDLVRKAYAIQRRHQFNSDEAGSLNDMRRLIDDFLDGEGGPK